MKFESDFWHVRDSRECSTVENEWGERELQS